MSFPPPLYYEGGHLRGATAGDLVLAFLLIVILVCAGWILIKRILLDNR